MHVHTLKQLVDWVDESFATTLEELTHAERARAGEDVAGVIWRHAFSQGMQLGDDWGWVLEMYTPDRVREIASESVRAAAR
jgi:hypothetical protein